MNKALIIVLAVCLVSVHAFVKRDAEQVPANGNSFDNIKKNFEDFAETVNKKVKETFNPDTIQKEFNSLIDNVKNAFDTITPKPNQAKE